MYMSPEVYLTSDNFDDRADIWAVGVMMFQLLTGKFVPLLIFFSCLFKQQNHFFFFFWFYTYSVFPAPTQLIP